MSNAHPAVVLGLSLNGLGLVRSLHAAGVPVIAVDQKAPSVRDTHRWMSSHTRLCRKIRYEDPSPDGLLHCLLSLGEQLPEKGVLFPSADEHVLCISRNRELLGRYYHFRVPSLDVVELLEDKARFLPLAESLGVSIPRTFVHPTADIIHEIASKISYPCLIKPNFRDQQWNHTFPGRKALTANDSVTLLDLFARVSSQYNNFFIQEVVPGPDCNLYFSHAYLSANLTPLALWTGRKIRQRPIHLGTSTMAETVRVDAVADATLMILHALGCDGYSSIEFKLDPRDRQYKIMEVTPGRTWYPHYLGFGAGINIPKIWYDDLIGQTPAPAQSAAEGVRWIDEYRDVLSSYEYWKNGELPIRDWLRSFRGCKTFGYASMSDPLPIACVFVRLLLAPLLRSLAPSQ